MGLGSSSRISVKRDLITRINLERSYQGMPIEEVQKMASELQRMLISDLQVLYKKILGERKAMNSERTRTERTKTETGCTPVA